MSTKKTPPGPPPASSSDPVLAALEALRAELSRKMEEGFAEIHADISSLSRDVHEDLRDQREGFRDLRAVVHRHLERTEEAPKKIEHLTERVEKLEAAVFKPTGS